MDFLLTKSGGTDDKGNPRKYYECGLCKKQTNDRSNMRRHMIRHHATPLDEPCPYGCGKIFKNQLTLSYHMNSRQCLKNRKFPIQIKIYLVFYVLKRELNVIDNKSSFKNEICNHESCDQFTMKKVRINLFQIVQLALNIPQSLQCTLIQTEIKLFKNQKR